MFPGSWLVANKGLLYDDRPRPAGLVFEGRTPSTRSCGTNRPRRHIRRQADDGSVVETRTLKALPQGLEARFHNPVSYDRGIVFYGQLVAFEVD